MYLFNTDITNWDKWGKAFQNIDAFSLLIEHIYKKEGLLFSEIENVSPGTNAVFSCGGYIIKIYAPKETGIKESEYPKELSALKRAYEHGVSVPKVVTYGTIHDRYDFSYLVMEKITGLEAGEVLKGFSDEQKYKFVQKLNHILSLINTKTPYCKPKSIEGPLENQRWNSFSSEVRCQADSYLKSLVLSEAVYVHGDLTGENVIVNDGDISIIDFGDSKCAPFYYEYPPIVFELFNHDTQLVREFAKGKESFEEVLFSATLLHDFGPFFLRDICIKKLNKEPGKLEDLSEIRMYINNLLNN